MSSGDESDSKPTSRDIQEDIHDGSQSRPSVIGERHTIKYVITLNKFNQNGREPYYQLKTWV